MKMGIQSMLIHPNSHRLYVQCSKSEQVICLEVSSGTFIQSLGISAKTDNNAKHRSSFALTVCGSILYTAIGNTITAWDHSNDSELGTNKIDFDKQHTTAEAYISSIAVHPKLKTILCGTVYGSTNVTHMFIVNNIYENKSSIATTIKLLHQQNLAVADDMHNGHALDGDGEAIDRWRQIRQEIFAEEQGVNTFDNILERIDNLFHMAIRSPNRTDDYKENIVRHKNESVQRLLLDREVAVLADDDVCINNITGTNVKINDKAGEVNANDMLYDTDTSSDGTFVVETNEAAVTKTNSP